MRADARRRSLLESFGNPLRCAMGTLALGVGMAWSAGAGPPEQSARAFASEATRGVTDASDADPARAAVALDAEAGSAQGAAMAALPGGTSARLGAGAVAFASSAGPPRVLGAGGSALQDARFLVLADAATGAAPAEASLRLSVDVDAALDVAVETGAPGAALGSLRLRLDVTSPNAGQLVETGFLASASLHVDAEGETSGQTRFEGAFDADDWLSAPTQPNHLLFILDRGRIEATFAVPVGAPIDVSASFVGADLVPDTGASMVGGRAAAESADTVRYALIVETPGVRIVAARDADADDILDADDNCPRISNAGGGDVQRDADGDGFGDACECGDASHEGFVDTRDSRLVQRCAVGQVACPPLCDATGDGVCDTLDARQIQRFAVGLLAKAELDCAERQGVASADAADVR